MRLVSTKLFLPLLIAVLLVGALPACSAAPAAVGLHLHPLEELPAELQTVAVNVRTAYQFAAANPEVLGEIPCYCGCGGIGHTSNYDCYVAGGDPEGEIHFDGHAVGCSICVDITADTMRLLGDGRTVSEIRAYVDSTYSQYGPSNMQ